MVMDGLLGRWPMLLTRAFFLLAAGSAVSPSSSNVLSAASPEGAVSAFLKLWENAFADATEVGEDLALRHLCQYGLSNQTAEVVRFFLARPGTTVEVRDVVSFPFFHAAAARGAAAVSAQLLGELRAEHGAGRVFSGGADLGARAVRQCDVVVFSEDAQHFSLELVLHRLGPRAVVALVSYPCIMDEKHIPMPLCNAVNMIWEKSALFRMGRCFGPVCLARLPLQAEVELRDPHVLPLDCADALGAFGSESAIGEFRQDWFLYRNFLQARGRGVYVDVGASLPFEYSSTVLLDRCLGWRGICVEPNPHMTTFLHRYRSCDVVQQCVSNREERHHSFVDRSGEFAFSASCSTLGEILRRAGVLGQRIDVLSIDVEHSELDVLAGLPLEEFDIRLIVIEVTVGVTWLQVDTLLLPRGYAKVAILGRDCVYAKLSELALDLLPSAWPLRKAKQPHALLPSAWSYFHQRVITEELLSEQKSEKAAAANGLRRR